MDAMFDKSSAIVIQWSAQDRAWIAAVHAAGHLLISRTMADGPTPTKAFRALSDVIEALEDTV